MKVDILEEILNLTQVSSLGNGFDHVMDAIGECEQASNQCRWSLFFGKEIFTPWHDAEFDEVASSLIYCQIIKSVLNGEFKFKSVSILNASVDTLRRGFFLEFKDSYFHTRRKICRGSFRGDVTWR